MQAVSSYQRKLFTLAFIVRDCVGSKQVLLGLKKRGFGMGKWNGFGGKVEVTDASIAAAAVRELEEEANVIVKAEDLLPCGILFFSFEKSEEMMEVHVFLAHKFLGEPSESEEMEPQWYDISKIPFKSMWVDDCYWLPHVLDGKSVQGQFYFAADESTLLDHRLEVTTQTNGDC
ncbi:-dihydro-8-oxoguanine triphosphatase-like [Plasmopara halstedii]|uniref:Oxidized purine nucleoside triphosphate hydrolase n=1 Tax=Plasmopara halstedii TaxID=4781 RepID=A0A0P1AYZ1_PLAHL|nr:-dihydro-8-oxoguanine triphosphatase-like [Plasmopara halstedii]CEG47049.1 -dihydro-8-oxoguanine triphosphatase-like [Plasmopara halstedii]|eukprot:XP_024583418.1 -dihydro-8-oxoguanine triphosphatase-like [Plasmopara halstedii]